MYKYELSNINEPVIHNRDQQPSGRGPQHCGLPKHMRTFAGFAELVKRPKHLNDKMNRNRPQTNRSAMVLSTDDKKGMKVYCMRSSADNTSCFLPEATVLVTMS